MKDYSAYPLKEAEALWQLDRFVEGIILEATICTEMDKLWRNGTAQEISNAWKSGKERGQTDEVLHD